MRINCKLGNFCENFSLVNSAKRHICDDKNSRLSHDLPISVEDRVILSFLRGFIFTKLGICEFLRKENPHENFRINNACFMPYDDQPVLPCSLIIYS